jgi:hypothetical protein
MWLDLNQALLVIQRSNNPSRQVWHQWPSSHTLNPVLWSTYLFQPNGDIFKLFCFQKSLLGRGRVSGQTDGSCTARKSTKMTTYTGSLCFLSTYLFTFSGIGMLAITSPSIFPSFSESCWTGYPGKIIFD